MVLKAITLFKKKLILSKIRRGELEKTELNKLNSLPVKFIAFTILIGEEIKEQMFNAETDAVKLS